MKTTVAETTQWKEWTLYRLYGSGGQLLYVGITSNFASRMRSHSEKHWWPEVRRIEVEDHETEPEARAAELKAIRTEGPRWNRAGRPKGDKPNSPPIPPAVRKGEPSVPHPLSIAQAADRAGVSRDTIRRRIADGTLPAYRVGPKLIRVDAAAVDALFRPIPTIGSF